MQHALSSSEHDMCVTGKYNHQNGKEKCLINKKKSMKIVTYNGNAT